MLYQKLLMGNKPYFVLIADIPVFEVHRHPEIEVCYCLEGSYDMICENKRHTLTAGDFVIVPPMASHEFPEQDIHSGKSIIMELGYTFLGEYFELFATLSTAGHHYQKCALCQTPAYKELVSCMEKMVVLDRSDSNVRELSIKSNLYQISALLLQILSETQTAGVAGKKVTDIKKIDIALQTIYNSYHQPLDIESVSTICGYSKSNFCKIFKSIAGDTFHNTLNRHRVEIACMLLKESNDSIEGIATETGFGDSKSFCRVFKKYIGQSASEYRKNNRR